MNNKQNNLMKVELVGGPLCGSIVDWPENIPSLTFNSSKALYEYEGVEGNPPIHKALYKGWAESEN